MAISLAPISTVAGHLYANRLGCSRPFGNTFDNRPHCRLAQRTPCLAVPTIASFSTDSGTVGDHITNDTLTLTGTAVANSTVNVYDGATLLGTAAANSSGAWSFYHRLL